MAKSIGYLFILLSISIIGFAQNLAKEKTELHQQIKGTNIFMIPPDSFVSSNNFQGFQNPNVPTSVIMIVEFPGPFSKFTEGFNADILKTKGMYLQSKKEICISGFKGLLMELDQAVYGVTFAKHILVYGNEKSSFLINGIYPRDSVRLGDKIKQSILSTFVATDLNSNPREAVDYTLDENAGSFKFISVSGNAMLLNRDMKIPTESIDKASLIAGKSLAKVSFEDEKLFCTERVKKYPGEYSIISSKRMNEVEIDRLKGYELYAKNKENEEMYQVVLFDPSGGYYLFVGTWISGNEKAISDIKKVIQTFKRKP